jgi:MscS family membrane protein
MLLSAIWSVAFVGNRIFAYFLQHSKENRIIMEPISKPVRMLSWVVALFFTITVVRNYYFNTVESILFSVSLKLALTALFHWSLLRLIKAVENDLLQIHKQSYSLDKTTIIALSRLAKIVAAIINGVIFLNIINVDVRAFLAVGSIGTIIIGIAARDMLANFFGGCMVFADRPFSVGDQIKIAEKSISGIVQNIGWRRTEIITPEQRPVYIPNSLFLSVGIENASRVENYFIKNSVKLENYTISRAKHAVAMIEGMLHHSTAINHDKPCTVAIDDFEGSGFNLNIYCFTSCNNFMDHLKAQQDILLKIAQIVKVSSERVVALPTDIEQQEAESSLEFTS